MYRDTWRIERDFFYDPHYHGLDIARRATTLRRIFSRTRFTSDFTYLTEEMIGYL